MTFFFGARTKKDLYYEDLFRDLEKKHSHFHYIPSLSAPSPDDDWSGERGLITKTVKKYVKDSHGKQAYLCGSPGMLKACAETLSDIGFSDEHIFFDSFG